MDMDLSVDVDGVWLDLMIVCCRAPWGGLTVSVWFGMAERVEVVSLIKERKVKYMCTKLLLCFWLECGMCACVHVCLCRCACGVCAALWGGGR